MPACPQRSECSPTMTLCPICTRLSILVPRPMTVSPSVARSIAALAPISTSSSSRTIPTCGILRCDAAVPDVSEPVRADDGARLQDAARPDPAPVENRGVGVQEAVLPDGGILAHEGAGREHRARADAGAGGDRGPGSHRDAGPEPRGPVHEGAPLDAGLPRAPCAGRPRATPRGRAAASPRRRRACRPPLLVGNEQRSGRAARGLRRAALVGDPGEIRAARRLESRDAGQPRPTRPPVPRRRRRRRPA